MYMHVQLLHIHVRNTGITQLSPLQPDYAYLVHENDWLIVSKWSVVWQLYHLLVAVYIACCDLISEVVEFVTVVLSVLFVD